MQSLQSLLPKVLKKRGLYVQAEASRVVFSAQRWLEERMPRLADAIHVEKLSQTTLSIGCRHSIAAQECHALLPQLKAYLQELVGPALVSEIRLLRAK